MNLPRSSIYNLDFKEGVTVYSNWLGGTTNSELLPSFLYNFGASKSSSFVVSKSSSATTDWPVPSSKSSSFMKVQTSHNELAVTINSPATVKFTESLIKMNYNSLMNIKNSEADSAYENSQLCVLIENSAKTVGLGSNRVQIGDVFVATSSETVKKVSIVHQNSENNLTVSHIDGSSTITDLTIEMNGGTHFYLRKGFNVVSIGQLSVEKAGGSGKATVYVLDAEKPPILNVKDPSIEVVLVDDGGGGDDDSGSGKKLKPGLIAAVVVVVVLLVVVIVVVVVFYIRSKKVDITNYDYAPPLLESGLNNNKNIDL